jgi:hypothetical protein
MFQRLYDDARLKSFVNRVSRRSMVADDYIRSMESFEGRHLLDAMYAFAKTDRTFLPDLKYTVDAFWNFLRTTPCKFMVNVHDTSSDRFVFLKALSSIVVLQTLCTSELRYNHLANYALLMDLFTLYDTVYQTSGIRYQVFYLGYGHSENLTRILTGLCDFDVYEAHPNAQNVMSRHLSDSNTFVPLYELDQDFDYSTVDERQASLTRDFIDAFGFDNMDKPVIRRDFKRYPGLLDALLDMWRR